jgi:hypothetical protein
MTLKDLLAGAAGALVVGLAWVGLHLLSKHARAPVSGGTIPGSGEGRPASEAEAEQS